MAVKPAYEKPAVQLIRGAQVLCGDPTDTQGQFDIRVEGAHITKMGPGLSQRGVDQVFDATGLTAMPGLVQAHTHLCQTLFRSQADDMELLGWLQNRIWPMEAALDDTTLRAAARLGLAELMLGGTTAILDMGTVHHTDVLFEEAARLGMRYTGGKTIMDQGQGFPEALRETTSAALAESVRLCKRWHGQADGRLRYAFSPRFVLSTSEAGLRGCAQLAREYGTLLHTHAAENSEEVAQVRARHGCGNIEYFERLGLLQGDVVLAHGVWLTAREQQLLAKRQTRIAHCPSSNLKLASGIARVEALRNAGITVALGADGAPCNNNLDGFLEMRLAALVHKVQGGPEAINARQAFHMATHAGAQALGLDDCGFLAPNMRADIVLLDLRRPHVWPEAGALVSRLVYAAKSSDVKAVWIDGDLCVSSGKLTHARTSSILQAATSATAKVRRAIGLQV